MRTTWRLRNGRRLMALSFPNQSRAYDATRRAVRFWGNDSAMEASLFVTEDSLKRIQPDIRFDEAGLLAAFALNRLLMYATAATVHRRVHKGSYHPLPDDFS